LPTQEDQRRGNLAWVLPSVTALSSILLVRLYHTPTAAVLGGVALFVVSVATIITHYHLRDDREHVRALAGAVLAFLTHACAFFLLTMMYSNKWRSMYSATAIGLASVLMLLQMTDGEELAWLRRLLYALVGGLLVGQATWALNYWAATGWNGGALLLVFFYLCAGLITQHSRGQLTHRVLAEYIAVAGAAFVIVTAAVTLTR
jgi:glucose uptake protein GlcU